MKIFRFYLIKKFVVGLLSLLLMASLLVACGEEATPVNSITPAAKTAPRLVATSASGAETALPTFTPAPPTVLPTATSAPAAGPTITPADKFSNDLAYEHVKELADKIGIRLAGSENEVKAADYIETYFRRLGLQTSRPEVSYASFVDKGSKMSYDSGASKVEITGDAVNLSGSGQLTAPLNYVGFGLAGQVSAGSLKGKIALLQRGQITFREKVDNVAAAGAVGVIVYNDREGRLTNVTLEKAFNIPVLGISQSEGEKLRQVLSSAGSAGLNINLNVQTITSVYKLHNVVGSRPAKEGGPTAPIIIIGGHYDTVATGPGANDNASGVATVLELAHLLVNKYPKYELRFIGFSGEEIGLVGSNDYVQNLGQDELKRLTAMINLDQIAVGQTLYFGGDPNLTKTAFGAAKALGAGDVQPLPAAYATASDHASFAETGASVLFVTRDTDPNNHKAGDTADKVRPELLGLAGNTVIKVIDALGGS